MSDEISVILELTEHETSALRSLLLRGVDWRQSGEARWDTSPVERAPSNRISRTWSKK